MVYCSKCGKKNEDDAKFCAKCGASLTGEDLGKKRDDQCDEACAVGKHSRGAPIFWGVIVILIGIWFLFEVVIKNTDLQNSLPPEIVNFEWWWLIGLIIVVAIIMTGVRMIIQK
jgi:uncharacterized membrane protein YvbJ